MKVLLLVIAFAATVSLVGNTEGKGSICMCVMIREVCVCVCIMHGLIYTNSYGYVANVCMLQKHQYTVSYCIVTEL